jgi:hypothetical protein
MSGEGFKCFLLDYNACSHAGSYQTFAEIWPQGGGSKFPRNTRNNLLHYAAP